MPLLPISDDGHPTDELDAAIVGMLDSGVSDMEALVEFALINGAEA